MTELRDCPDCEQGKHQNCDSDILNDDDRWVPCPCYRRGHITKEKSLMEEKRSSIVLAIYNENLIAQETGDAKAISDFLKTDSVRKKEEK